MLPKLLFISLISFQLTGCVTFISKQLYDDSQHSYNEFYEVKSSYNFYDGYENSEDTSFYFPGVLAGRNDNAVLKLDVYNKKMKVHEITRKNEIVNKEVALIISFFISNIERDYLTGDFDKDIIVLIPNLHDKSEKYEYTVLCFKANENQPYITFNIPKEDIEINKVIRSNILPYTRFIIYPLTIATDIILTPVYLVGGIGVLILYYTGHFIPR